MKKHSSFKISGMAMLSAAFVSFGVDRAKADLHGIIGGLAIGCVSGVLNCGNKRRSSGKSSGISSAQRQQNRDVQSSLNAFNFPVGTVDGSLGPKSRAAISNYQAYMGWNPTGRLDDFQRSTLVDSWRKLESGGGYAYPNMMQREGPRGLLRTALNPNYPTQFGDNVQTPQYGNTQPNYANAQPNYGNTQPNYGGNNGNLQQAGVQPQVPGQARQELSNPAPQAGGGALPTLAPIGAVPVSMASRCELVELTTQAQGVIMSGNMTDPNQALSEKFCDSRSFAITQSQFKLSQLAVSETEMTGSCTQIGQAMAPVVAGLAGGNAQSMVTQASAVNGQLGLADPANASTYGEICLGMGYRQDNADMALAGALVLTAAGRAPYGETVGHHLREGFGVSAAPAAASDWYTSAITALEQGMPPAFEPSSTRERVAVIRAAIDMGGLRASLGTGTGIQPVSNIVLMPRQ